MVKIKNINRQTMITKHNRETKDWATRTPLQTAGEFGWFGRVSSSCSTNDIRRVTFITYSYIRCDNPHFKHWFICQISILFNPQATFSIHFRNRLMIFNSGWEYSTKVLRILSNVLLWETSQIYRKWGRSLNRLVRNVNILLFVSSDKK